MPAYPPRVRVIMSDDEALPGFVRATHYDLAGWYSTAGAAPKARGPSSADGGGDASDFYRSVLEMEPQATPQSARKRQRTDGGPRRRHTAGAAAAVPVHSREAACGAADLSDQKSRVDGTAAAAASSSSSSSSSSASALSQGNSARTSAGPRLPVVDRNTVRSPEPPQRPRPQYYRAATPPDSPDSDAPPSPPPSRAPPQDGAPKSILKRSAAAPPPFYCAVCRETVTSTAAEHNVSIAHVFNAQAEVAPHHVPLPAPVCSAVVRACTARASARGRGCRGQGHCLRWAGAPRGGGAVPPKEGCVPQMSFHLGCGKLACGGGGGGRL